MPRSPEAKFHEEIAQLSVTASPEVVHARSLAIPGELAREAQAEKQVEQEKVEDVPWLEVKVKDGPDWRLGMLRARPEDTSSGADLSPEEQIRRQQVGLILQIMGLTNPEELAEEIPLAMVHEGRARPLDDSKTRLIKPRVSVVALQKEKTGKPMLHVTHPHPVNKSKIGGTGSPETA